MKTLALVSRRARGVHRYCRAVLGGGAFPLVVFMTPYAWPALERRVTNDRRGHDLLDHPTRTAIGAALVPIIVFLITRSAACALGRSEEHSLRDWQVEIVSRGPADAVEYLEAGDDGPGPPPSELPVGTIPGRSDRRQPAVAAEPFRSGIGGGAM